MHCRSRSSRSSRRGGHGPDDWGFADMQADIERSVHNAFAGAHQGAQMGRDARAAHLRHMRRMRDARRGGAGACPAGPPVWAYWWLVFPLVFGVLPALGFHPGRIGADIGRAAERWANGLANWSPLTLLEPVVGMFARLTGLSMEVAASVLIAAAVVNGLAIVIALRMRR